jgi:hypothetical protein
MTNHGRSTPVRASATQDRLSRQWPLAGRLQSRIARRVEYSGPDTASRYHILAIRYESDRACGAYAFSTGANTSIASLSRRTLSTPTHRDGDVPLRPFATPTHGAGATACCNGRRCSCAVVVCRGTAPSVERAMPCPGSVTDARHDTATTAATTVNMRVMRQRSPNNDNGLPHSGVQERMVRPSVVPPRTQPVATARSR